MKVKKNDFVEIEFTGKANDEVFDTTKKSEAEKMGVPDADVKPAVVCVGNQMLLKAFDDALENKEVGKKYSIKLQPEQAFGPRDPKLIKTIPMKIFIQKDLNPVPGMTFQMDNYIVKILSVSGGRVIVDFNNLLAGKEVDYDFKITRKITDKKEKINSLQDFFFKKRFDFEIKEKDKKVVFKENKIKPLLDALGKKLKDMTGFDFVVEEVKEPNTEKQQ